VSDGLQFIWQGACERVQEADARLFPFDQRVPGAALTATARPDGFGWENLAPECYLLSLRYRLDGKHFDSCYFQLDVPDITLIQLDLGPQGSQLNQMGFSNAQGEFVDMLIYADEKPWLTRAVEDFPFLQVLAEFLVFRFGHLTPAEARAQLNQLLGDLARCLPELEHLWPYQLKMLMQPAYLAQTTPAWKACLFWLLRNNLILADDEALYEHLQEATALAQQQEAVARLCDEFDGETGHATETLLKALSGKRMTPNPP
jgi:hypothetical protein